MSDKEFFVPPEVATMAQEAPIQAKGESKPSTLLTNPETKQAWLEITKESDRLSLEERIQPNTHRVVDQYEVTIDSEGRIIVCG
jgi:hypothetical protein